jgi:hypothetical protein
MLKINNLTNNLYTVSGTVKGIKKRIEDKDVLELLIECDLSELESVKYPTVMIDIEDYEDARTNKQCALYDVNLLINFHSRPTPEDLELIEKHLNDFLISEIK